MTDTTRDTGTTGAALLLAAGLVPLLGIAVAPAAGWPDSLQGATFGEALPALEANRLAFRVGYGALALAGLLFLPAAVHLSRVLAGDRPDRPVARQLAALAVASGTLRGLWYGAELTVVPVLERLWRGGAAATRSAVDVFYVGFNDLMSTVQEDIGVNLFGGAFVLLASVLIVRGRAYPRWLGVVGLVTGVSFVVSSSEMIGIPTGDVIPVVGPALVCLWLAGLGVSELRSLRAPADRPAPAVSSG